MLTFIRSLVVLALLSFSSHSWAACYYFWDKIRDHQLQQIDCHSEDGNSVLVVDYGKRTAQIQHKSAIRQVGVHFRNPEAFKWPVFTSNRFTIRFDPDIASILQLRNMGVMKDRHLFLWPPCFTRPDLNDDCGLGLPRIDSNMRGQVRKYIAPDQRAAYTLTIAQSQDFEHFDILIRGSRRIIVEVAVTDGPSQLEFIR
jgi:hypothetical protein